MSTISYDDFAKMDLRVGKIVSAEKISGKTRIVKGVIDFLSTRRSNRKSRYSLGKS